MHTGRSERKCKREKYTLMMSAINKELPFCFHIFNYSYGVRQKEEIKQTILMKMYSTYISSLTYYI